MNLDEAMARVQEAQATQQSQTLKSGTDDQQRLKEACQEFEAIFLNMMLKQMRSTVEESTLVDKSQGRRMFEEMHDEELASSISQGRGIGLAQDLYQQLSQERTPVMETQDPAESDQA